MNLGISYGLRQMQYNMSDDAGPFMLSIGGDSLVGFGRLFADATVSIGISRFTPISEAGLDVSPS